jgi:protein-disulfide isomerase
MIGLFLSVIVLGGLLLFAVQVAGYVRDIKAGKPDPFAARNREVKMSRILNQEQQRTVDLSRIKSDEKNPMLGNPEAQIEIVEFLDYECPFCRQTAPALRAFMAAHADQVILTVRDFPLETLHPSAMSAAIAARCVFAQGDPNKYWRYHDVLFAEQDNLSSPALRVYAEAVGVDVAQYDECVSSRATEEGIRNSMADGAAAGVSGTPTFFVNGRTIPGALDRETLEEMFRQLTEKNL